jgi:hypothetical protein
MPLDWTGREIRAEKRGAIPDHLATCGRRRDNHVDAIVRPLQVVGAARVPSRSAEAIACRR